MLTRRGFLRLVAGAVLGGTALAAYAVGIEPMLLMRVKHYALTPANWPAGFKLKIAALADVHASRPWMSPERIRRVVDETNALNADIILLLGDYECSMRFQSGRVGPSLWAPALSGLEAPLGVHAILGNHDWWDDVEAQKAGKGPTLARRSLEEAGIPVYENDVVRLEKDGHAFWLAGLADQLALRPGRAEWIRNRFIGLDDLRGTLRKVDDDAPVILLAHEPDIFPEVPSRVALTLSGHTHGGQIRVFGYSPVVPSRHGNRFAYGHVVEQGRNLIISGGLGFSILPVRLGVRPEILMIELG